MVSCQGVYYNKVLWSENNIPRQRQIPDSVPIEYLPVEHIDEVRVLKQ